MDILKYGNLRLKEVAKDVTDFNDDLISLINQMYDIMVRANGIGLAASQIDKLVRVVVIEVEENNKLKRYDLVNPVITDYSDETSIAEEGCLSIPGISADVKRAYSVHVSAKTPYGKDISFKADELLARAIQHEVDHLNGILFVDRISDVDKKRLKKELKKIKRKYSTAIV